MNGAKARWRPFSIAGLGILAGLFAAALSYAIYAGKANPGVALALYPGLPTAASRLGDLTTYTEGQEALKQGPKLAPGSSLPPSVITGIGLDLSPAAKAKISALALTALRHSPLSASALRQLVFVEGDAGKRRQLLDLAEQVSRRDLLVSLQLAELRLRDGDMDAATGSLDRALVVSTNSDPAVFPVMLQAITVDAEFAGQVRKALARDPIWSERMVRFALANPQYLPGLTQVVGSIPPKSTARAVGYGQQMVDMLTSQGFYREAFAAYKAYAPGRQDFADLTDGTFAPIDWQLIDNLDTGGRPFGEGRAELFANPNREGEAARIVTALKPGTYRMAFRLSETEGRGGSAIIRTTCLGKGIERGLASYRIPLANGSQFVSLDIPAQGCSFQRLSFWLFAGYDTSSVLLDRTRVTRQANPAPAQ